MRLGLAIQNKFPNNLHRNTTVEKKTEYNSVGKKYKSEKLFKQREAKKKIRKLIVLEKNTSQKSYFRQREAKKIGI